MQNFVSIGQKENQTPVSSAVTSVQTLAFRNGLDAAGNLVPIRQTFNHVVFGLDINLPVFNRNQGAVVADTAAIERHAVGSRRLI